jgi:probable HAF family extracellular repeat protein
MPSNTAVAAVTDVNGDAVLKTTRITVETDMLMVIRRARSVLAWCPNCRAEVNVITLGSGSLAEAATAAQLQQWLNTGKLHFWQRADESAQLCVPSLLQCIECEGVPIFSPPHPEPLNQPRRKCMKLTRSIANLFRITSFALALALIAAPMSAHGQASGQATSAHPSQYTVIDLGTLTGGTFSQPFFINQNGWVSGSSALSGGATHGVVWSHHQLSDLGTLGGTNSIAFATNTRGEAVGEAETSLSDPNGEDFCGFGTHLQCLPFRSQNGVMVPLPTLGGNNGGVNQINSRGEAVGFAENAIPDTGCPAPQVLHFEPVIWENTTALKLPTYDGDPDGAALAINDHGLAVGSSGACASFSPVLLNLQAIHALLWDKGKPLDLGNLGGPTGQAGGNIAWGINNRNEVIGVSDLPGDSTFHAFRWTKATGMQDLGTLPGDVASSGSGINDAGIVVGLSLDAKFNGRAFLWRNGNMTDLNTLAPTSPLFLLSACSINFQGQITGLGVTSTGDLHAYLAIPNTVSNSNSADGFPQQEVQAPSLQPVLSEHDRQTLLQQLRLLRFAAQPPEPPDPCLKYSELSPGCRVN